MKFKNKLLLSLGTTVSIVSPMVTVVSCKSSKEVSVSAAEQKALWAKSQNIIETKYQQMLLAKITDKHDADFGKLVEADLNDWNKVEQNVSLKAFIYNFIKQNIYQNSNYLSTFADQLIHTVNESSQNKTDFYQYGDLQRDGFYDYFDANTDITKDTTTNGKIKSLIDKFMPVIWSKNILNFQNTVYKTLIAYIYLDTSKENWKAVFETAVGATDKVNGYENNLTSDKFVLGQKLVRAKYSYGWNITLTDAQSRGFSGVTKTEDELNTSLKQNGDIFKLAALSKQKALVPSFFYDKTLVTTTRGDDIWTLLAENKDLAGFKGITASSAYVPSDLTLIKDYLDYDKRYEGYIDSKNTTTLDNDKIELTRPDSATINVEKALVIMPEYVGGQLTLANLKNTVSTDIKDDLDTMKQIVLGIQGSAIYNEAIKYYSSKDNQEFNWDAATKIGGIRLTITDESLKKVAIDSFDLEYIERD